MASTFQTFNSYTLQLSQYDVCSDASLKCKLFAFVPILDSTHHHHVIDFTLWLWDMNLFTLWTINLWDCACQISSMTESQSDFEVKSLKWVEVTVSVTVPQICANWLRVDAICHLATQPQRQKQKLSDSQNASVAELASNCYSWPRISCACMPVSCAEWWKGMNTLHLFTCWVSVSIHVSICWDWDWLCVYW